jgi:hypothetical protein
VLKMQHAWQRNQLNSGFSATNKSVTFTGSSWGEFIFHGDKHVACEDGAGTETKLDLSMGKQTQQLL